MDLLEQFWFGFRGASRQMVWLVLPFALFACAAKPTQSETNKQPVAEKSAPETPDQEAVTYKPLTPELVYYILTAEIAGQRGAIGIASDMYEQAANSVDSPLLADRAARVATFTRDRARINRALSRWKEVDPNDADVQIMQIPFLIDNQQYSEAIETMDKAIALAPEKTIPYLATFAKQLSEMEDAETALPMMRSLQSYQEQSADTRFAYARLAAHYREWALAHAELDALLEEQPKHEPFLTLQSEILQRTGKPEQALDLIANVAKKPDASAELRFAYGKLLGENGHADEAKAVFEALNLENPDNQDVLFALGLLALEEQDGDTARTYFTEVLRKGDPAQQVGYFMGLAEEMSGNYDAALVWFASVPAESQRFDSAQARYIGLLADQGDMAKARQHLRLLRQERPEQARELYIFEASFLHDEGLSEEAMRVYSEALTAFPDDFELLYSRAMLAESLDDLTLLETDLRRILAIDPDNAQTLNALGYTLTDRTDRHQEALEMIQKALQIKPGDPYYLDSLGWVYYRLGDLEKAETYLRQALAVQDDAEFSAHLGEVVWVQGNRREARKIWQQALEKYPDNDILTETMERFE
ncbi:TPR repeat protein [Methylophaga frappieri]|uniref:TPR repeat protein n=1 Tax=Methylophaga frappieri (strain ATCC BAA-2434 / DSM 25690 / JAM7) TaxID=754477 RepID=I1YJZ1_METFJ|nr:tetratricopeptide repeat protein [Methylophaga frappieri]AFJ03234.1 TPR repeat protein [Methylophaga frappieri]